MKTAIAKLAVAFLMVAAMAGCASTGVQNPSNFDSVNDIYYGDTPYSVG